MTGRKKHVPLVYSCSGCSNAGQMANHIALQLDRKGLADMSCIAGIGGDAPSLLKLARSGRKVIVLDGCQLTCAKNSLARHGITPQHSYQLQKYGVKKRPHVDFDMQQAQAVIAAVESSLVLDRMPAADGDRQAASGKVSG